MLRYSGFGRAAYRLREHIISATSKIRRRIDRVVSVLVRRLWVAVIGIAKAVMIIVMIIVLPIMLVAVVFPALVIVIIWFAIREVIPIVINETLMPWIRKHVILVAIAMAAIVFFKTSLDLFDVSPVWSAWAGNLATNSIAIIVTVLLVNKYIEDRRRDEWAIVTRQQVREAADMLREYLSLVHPVQAMRHGSISRCGDRAMWHFAYRSMSKYVVKDYLTKAMLQHIDEELPFRNLDIAVQQGERLVNKLSQILQFYGDRLSAQDIAALSHGQETIKAMMKLQDLIISPTRFEAELMTYQRPFRNVTDPLRYIRDLGSRYGPIFQRLTYMASAFDELSNR